MIKQITVLTQEKDDSPVMIENVRGAGDSLVIHRTCIRKDGSDLEYQFTYTITHKPTGRRMIVCRNLLQAKRVKDQLENLPVDWSLKDIDKLKEAVRKTDYFEIHKANDIDYLETRARFDV